MRQSLLVGEEVRVPLHGDAEPLGQNVVPGRGYVLRPLDISLVGLVGDGSTEIRLGLQPRRRIRDLLEIIESIVEDGRMRIRVLAPQDVEELHLHVVARRVPDSPLGRHGQDEPVVDLGSPLLDGAYDILTNITGQPLVHRVHLGPKTLKLVDGHGTDLEETVRHEVLDPLLGGDELLAKRPITGRVLKGSLGHEIEQGTLGPGDGGAEGLHDLLSLLHGRRSRHLMGGRRVNRQEVGLQESFVQRLRPASSNDNVLLVDEALLHPTLLEMAAGLRLVGDVDRSLGEEPPAEDLLSPEFEAREQAKIGSVSEGHLRFREADESLHSVAIVIKTGIANPIIDPVHLHLDLLADRDSAGEDIVSELCVISRGSGIRQHSQRRRRRRFLPPPLRALLAA